MKRPLTAEAPSTSPVQPTTEEDALVARFKHVTETLLPARARAERWPIRFDHCFKRICLDHACGDVWYNHLQRPAERHLHGLALLDAVRCAEELLAGDRALLAARDAESLRMRGKRGRAKRG